MTQIYLSEIVKSDLALRCLAKPELHKTIANIRRKIRKSKRLFIQVV